MSQGFLTQHVNISRKPGLHGESDFPVERSVIDQTACLQAHSIIYSYRREKRNCYLVMLIECFVGEISFDPQFICIASIESQFPSASTECYPLPIGARRAAHKSNSLSFCNNSNQQIYRNRRPLHIQRWRNYILVIISELYYNQRPSFFFHFGLQFCEGGNT